MGEQIISIKRELAQAPIHKSERRASVRFLVRDENICQPVAASMPGQPDIGWFGQVLDVSLSGVALLLTRPFEAGTLLVVELSDRAQREPPSFLVNVVHARPEGTKGWLIGCEFIFPLREGELHALITE
jgi:hypothetical protein